MSEKLLIPFLFLSVQSIHLSDFFVWQCYTCFICVTIL